MCISVCFRLSFKTTFCYKNKLEISLFIFALPKHLVAAQKIQKVHFCLNLRTLCTEKIDVDKYKCYNIWKLILFRMLWNWIGCMYCNVKTYFEMKYPYWSPISRCKFASHISIAFFSLVFNFVNTCNYDERHKTSTHTMKNKVFE